MTQEDRKRGKSSITDNIHIIEFNSRDRLSEGFTQKQDSANTSSNFTIDIPSNAHNMSSFFIDSITIPLTFYIVSDRRKNNKLQIIHNLITTDITIKTGSPSPSELVTYLKQQLTAINAGFDVAFDNYDDKITFSHSTDNFEIKFTAPYTHKLLGFSKDATYSGTTSYTSDNMPNTTGQELRVYSKTLSNFITTIGSRDNYFITSIPVTIDANSYLKYEPLRTILHSSNKQYVSNIDFWITDENKEILDLNNQDILISIGIN